MSELIRFSVTVFMGFFAIMNPIANVPIFLGLTSDMSKDQRRAVALRSTALAFAIVLLFSVAGHLVFEMFGIGLPAFRTTGGILVFLVGKHLLEGQHRSPVQSLRRQESPETDLQRQVERPDTDIAISPLAIPILAGPGTIACAINFSSGRSPTHIAICVGGFLVLCVITYGFFMGGQGLLRYLGDSAVQVISRLMGLILAVMGVQMAFEGLGGAFPKLFS